MHGACEPTIVYPPAAPEGQPEHIVYIPAVKAMSLVVQELLKKIEGYWSVPMVVSVPARFTAVQIADMVQAVYDAGVTKEQIKGVVQEPTAILISAIWMQLVKLSSVDCQRVVVVDIGGGTSDYSILDVSTSNKLPYLATGDR